MIRTPSDSPPPRSWNFLKKNVNARSGVFHTLRQKSTEEQADLIESAELLCSKLLEDVHTDVLAANREEYLKRVASIERNVTSNATHVATVCTTHAKPHLHTSMLTFFAPLLRKIPARPSRSVGRKQRQPPNVANRLQRPLSACPRSAC